MSTKLGRPTASATRREASRRWGGGAPACNVRRSTTAVRAVDTARPVGDTRTASPRTSRGRSAVLACDRSDMIEIQEPTDLVVNTEYEFCGMRRTEAQCFFVPAASEHATYEAAAGPALQVVKWFPPAF